jgi:hypothetical protein
MCDFVWDDMRKIWEAACLCEPVDGELPESNLCCYCKKEYCTGCWCPVSPTDNRERPNWFAKAVYETLVKPEKPQHIFYADQPPSKEYDVKSTPGVWGSNVPRPDPHGMAFKYREALKLIRRIARAGKDAFDELDQIARVCADALGEEG